MKNETLRCLEKHVQICKYQAQMNPHGKGYFLPTNRTFARENKPAIEDVGSFQSTGLLM